MRRARSIPVLLPALLLAVLLCASCSRGPVDEAEGPLYVQVTLSTNEVHIGDVFSATVVVRHPADSQVEVPDPANEKEIVVRNRDWRSTPVSDDRIRTTVDYRLTSFRVGEHLISTGTVTCTTTNGETITQAFPEVSVNVLSLVASADEAQRDIKGLADWKRPVPRWLIALVAVVALAFAAAVAAAYFLGTPRTILQQAPPPPPHKIALAALRRLKEKHWIEERRYEPFYVEVSAITRRYIEDRFDLRAPELTTEEFIREASHSRALSGEHQHLTYQFLVQCDLVKFARHEPEQSDMQAALAAAERLVTETIPAEPETEKEEAS